MKTLRILIFLSCAAATRLFAGEVDVSKLPPAAAAADFNQDIKSILENSCVGCHGAEKQKGGLRLDTRANLLKGGKDDKAIIERNSAKSPLIHYAARIVEDMEMPPKGKGEPLTAQQIGLLRAWIDAGAPWPDGVALTSTKKSEGEAPEPSADPKKLAHWAFKAPVKPAAPKIKNKKWVRNPIDNFVLARLEKEGLQPAPETDKITLMRRLSLDLIGLPPTIAEVDAFLADKSKNAYEKQVERLLASPHYGERQGRHWLDAARYADSDGFEKDKPRLTWAYRDWVIGAFNRDLPYDQFIIEQIAGDQLPNPTQEQLVATGYLRNSMINEEGGVDPEQFRMEAMFDRMDAIGKGILGVTIQCAQCHSHKYDPITQEDYYRMFAFLNNDHEATTPVYSPNDLMKRADILRQVHEIEADMQHRANDWRERMDKWEDSVRNNQPQWTVVQPVVEDISTGGQRYLPQKDGSLLALGYAPTKHTVKMTAKTDIQNITALRLELMNDPNLPLNGPGRCFVRGTCALTEFVVEAASSDATAKKTKVKFAKASADFEDKPDTPLAANYEDKSGKKRITGPIGYALDDKDETAWGINADPGRRNVSRKAVFNCEKPISNAKGTELTFQIKQNHGGWNSDDLMTNNLGRFRLSVTNAPEAAADPIPANVREIFSIPREKRSPAQIAAVFKYWRTIVAEWKDANEKIEALWKQHPEPVTQLSLTSREEMRDTTILKRGDWLKPGKPVTPGVPALLHQLPSNAPPTRLTFAKWLSDKESPTTARAFVNRMWQQYFGTGIVSTSEDFGTQCDAPSHPELLDWLASEFMERGWSIKEMQRLIVNSAAYRQSSRISPELYAKDQYNRLLARGTRLRVDGEIVRDIALSVSGLLNPKLGGRSVMPPAPAFVFLPPASYAPFPWIEETGPERYRRAVYTLRRRSTPYPMLQTFDVPEGNTSCVRRVRSNTPLQALMTLNETLFVECAQAFARKILEEGGANDIERIAYAFRRCLSRVPANDETNTMLALLSKQRARIADGWVNQYELATGKNALPANLPAGTTPNTLAAYTILARVMLNLDETITKE